jgi:hypothetical protein
MCQREVNSVISAQQSLGPGSWDSYDLMGVQVVVNTWVPPTQAGTVFNGVDYPGPIVPGYWNPTQVGYAFFLFAGATQYAQYGPNVPRIGPEPPGPPDHIKSSDKPGCFVYTVALGLGVSSWLDPGGVNNAPEGAQGYLENKVRDETIMLIAKGVGTAVALRVAKNVIAGLGVLDLLDTAKSAFQARAEGKCQPLVSVNW